MEVEVTHVGPAGDPALARLDALHEPVGGYAGLEIRTQKLIAAIQLSGTIVGAIAVSPGARASSEELDQALELLADRVSELTEASMQSVSGHTRGLAKTKVAILVRQMAADAVCAAWRVEHASAALEGLSPAKMAQLMERVFDRAMSEDLGREMDPIAAGAPIGKRLALLGVAPDIFAAITSFDFLAPDDESREQMLTKGLRTVVRATDGVLHDLGRRTVAAEEGVVADHVISALGRLYATHWRAHSAQTVAEIRRMTTAERERLLYLHRDGLPTDAIADSFEGLSSRVAKLVCDMVPENAEAEPYSPKILKHFVLDPIARIAGLITQLPTTPHTEVSGVVRVLRDELGKLQRYFATCQSQQIDAQAIINERGMEVCTLPIQVSCAELAAGQGVVDVLDALDKIGVVKITAAGGPENG